MSELHIPEEGRSAGLMTAQEVADLLGVPESWVYEQTRRGVLPAVHLGRYRRYERTAIQAFIAAHHDTAGDEEEGQ